MPTEIATPLSKPKMIFFGVLFAGVATGGVVVGWRRMSHAVAEAGGFTPAAGLDLLFVGIVVAAAAFVLWTLYRAARTSISVEGIVQPGLRGEAGVRWCEVTSVVSERGTLRIRSPQGRAVVVTGWYAEPDQVKQAVLAMCAKAGASIDLEKDDPPDDPYQPG